MIRRKGNNQGDGIDIGNNFRSGTKDGKKKSKGHLYLIICVTILGFLCFLRFHQPSNEAALRIADSRITPMNGPQLKVDQDETSQKLSPFFSLKPLTKSLHPKWKLWTEMSTEQQDLAMEEVGVYMRKYGKMIYPGENLGSSRSIKQGSCEFDTTIGTTGHTVCGPAPEEPCSFISFGINDNASWDTEIADAWGCRGFAGDPTVKHPSKLHENVTFHNIGATMLQDNEERLTGKGGEVEWWMTSFPKLRYFLGLEKVDILKIDCEGCEVAMQRDILREDPRFLFHVDQISIETHVTKAWMTTREHVYYFGLMFPLLEEAGFVMEWSSVFGCSKRHEVPGCIPELKKYGWPCGYDPWPGHPNVVHGYSCQEFTWKRYDNNERDNRSTK